MTVIVTAYDRLAWLRVCLLSVLNQTFPDFKLIVVDDGSSIPLTEQPEILEIVDDPRVNFIRKPNGGPASARNVGLRTADSEYVFMLDSDDILEPDAIETLLKTAGETSAEFVAGGWANFGTALEQRQIVRPKPRFCDAYANCVEQGWALGSVLLKTDKTIFYNEKRMPWEALEFFLDYLAPGRRAAYVDRVVVSMRQHLEPSRLTIAHDHFEPFATGSFFAEKKRQLIQFQLLNPERSAALDARILSSVHSLLRLDRAEEARELYDQVSWDRLASRERLKFGSFSWSSRALGFTGAKAFIAINRLLGRA